MIYRHHNCTDLLRLHHMSYADEFTASDLSLSTLSGVLSEVQDGLTEIRMSNRTVVFDDAVDMAHDDIVNTTPCDPPSSHTPTVITVEDSTGDSDVHATLSTDITVADMFPVRCNHDVFVCYVNICFLV